VTTFFFWYTFQAWVNFRAEALFIFLIVQEKDKVLEKIDDLEEILRGRGLGQL